MICFRFELYFSFIEVDCFFFCFGTGERGRPGERADGRVQLQDLLGRLARWDPAHLSACLRPGCHDAVFKWPVQVAQLWGLPRSGTQLLRLWWVIRNVLRTPQGSTWRRARSGTR